MIRRASVDDAEDVNDWIWRDSGIKPELPLLPRRPDERLPD
jgi:hypothetical protein